MNQELHWKPIMDIPIMYILWPGHLTARLLLRVQGITLCRYGMLLPAPSIVHTRDIRIRYILWPGLLTARLLLRVHRITLCRYGMLLPAPSNVHTQDIRVL